MKVYEVHEENHGLVCIAASVKAGFQYLIKHKWLDCNTEVWINDGFVKIGQLMWYEGLACTEGNLLLWCMKNANNYDMWDGLFYFYENAIVEEEV